jgi:hypothetical protein
MKTRLENCLIMALILGIIGPAQGFQEIIPPGFGEIMGKVLNADGHPVPKARVYAEPINQPASRPPVTYTDDEGKFSLKRVPVGAYMIHAVKEGEGYPDTYFAFFVASPKSVPKVAVREGEITHSVVVRLGPKAARLVGKVLDGQTGQPVLNARIILSRRDDPNAYFSTGPSSPAAQFQILVPSIPFKIKVSAPNYKDWFYGGNDPGDKTDFLHLAPDSTKELIISLTPAK